MRTTESYLVLSCPEQDSPFFACTRLHCLPTHSPHKCNGHFHSVLPVHTYMIFRCAWPAKIFLGLRNCNLLHKQQLRGKEERKFFFEVKSGKNPLVQVAGWHNNIITRTCGGVEELWYLLPKQNKGIGSFLLLHACVQGY